MANMRVMLLLSFVITACASNAALTGTTSGGAAAVGGSQAAGGASAGGNASGTGGMLNVSAICDGLFSDVPRASGYESFDISPSSDVDAATQSNCDIALGASLLSGTPAPYVNSMLVALDCSLVPPMPDNSPDAGVSDGFVIDSAESPAHLRLIGYYCRAVLAPGTHHIDVVVGSAEAY